MIKLYYSTEASVCLPVDMAFCVDKKFARVTSTLDMKT